MCLWDFFFWEFQLKTHSECIWYKSTGWGPELNKRGNKETRQVLSPPSSALWQAPWIMLPPLLCLLQHDGLCVFFWAVSPNQTILPGFLLVRFLTVVRKIKMQQLSSTKLIRPTHPRNPCSVTTSNPSSDAAECTAITKDYQRFPAFIFK